MTSTFAEDNPQYKQCAEDCQAYLTKRGLDTKRLPVCLYRQVNHGLFTKEPDGTYVPYLLYGWAILVKGPTGELSEPEERCLFRPLNWLSEGLYKRSGGRYIEYEDRPKFIATGIRKKDMNYFTRDYSEVVQSPLIMIHEKYASAVHFTNATDIPAVALSGCANWSLGGQLSPTLRKIVEQMPWEAQIAVMFDGDIEYNLGIREAAGKLRGWIAQLRPDLVVKIIKQPPLPLPLNGFDDWCTLKLREGKNLAVECLSLLNDEGLDITCKLPTGYLINTLGLEHTEDRDGEPHIVQSGDNYFKLSAHERWKNYARNFDGLIFDLADLTKHKCEDDLVLDYVMWLESQVFHGKECEAVSKAKCKDTVRRMLSAPKRQVSIPHLLLEQLPEVTEEEAKLYALRMCKEGMGITGPYSDEELAETWLRMVTDLCALWSDDISVKVDWICGLVGPSGCGKSSFPRNFLDYFTKKEYPPSVAQLAKSGSRSEYVELFRQVRDSLIAVVDEYDPEETVAHKVESTLLTLSTTRFDTFRNLNENGSTRQIRHAGLFLTTTDKNRQYIHTSPGCGERRFITFDVNPTTTYGGAACMDFKTIAECAAPLMRYGYQRYLAKDFRDATDFSRQYVHLYMDEHRKGARVIGELMEIASMLDGERNLEQIFNRFYEEYYREHTDDVRFSLMDLQARIFNNTKFSQREREWLRGFILRSGATDVGKARVGRANISKDKAYSIKDWSAFTAALLAAC